MKLTRLLVLVAMIALTCSVAMADGTDPVFKLGPGGHSIVLTSDTFSFTVSRADATVGFVSFDFINFTGAVIKELDLMAPGTTTPIPPSPGIPLSFACDNTGDIYFNTCSPTTLTPGPTTISFFGLDETHTGIPTATAVSCEEESSDCIVTGGAPNSDFIITVAVADMPVGSSFKVEATLVPAAEPSTLLMVLAAGLGFLAVKRSGFAI